MIVARSWYEMVAKETSRYQDHITDGSCMYLTVGQLKTVTPTLVLPPVLLIVIGIFKLQW